MPFTVDSVGHPHILYIKINDPWSLEELEAGYGKIESMLNHAECTIHAIIDMSRMRTLASGALQAYYGPLYHHARKGHVVFVVGTRLGQAVVERALLITRFDRAHIVSSYEEAQAILDDLIDSETV